MKLSKGAFQKARDFILTNARMIERRLFQFYFEDRDSKGVFHALYAYRNKDGGFGHGMEPDTASPESQPLFSVMALETLDQVGYLSKDQIRNDFLPYFISITTEKGGIPWMLQPKSEYPSSDHFKTVKEWAALSTTAPLLGILLKYGIDTPWIENAEKFVWSEFERIKEKHVFCYLCVPRWLNFLEQTQDKLQANQVLNNLKDWVLTPGVLCNNRADKGWGLYGKPHRLNYAPSPNSLANAWFDKTAIDADLTQLIKTQKNDGRWDTWYGISDGTKLEWAGMQTLWSLKTLKEYGRIEN